MNGNADDTDKADLRGFLSRLRRDEIRLATNYTNFHELDIHFVPVNALSRKRSLCLIRENSCNSWLEKLSPQAKENPRKSA